MSATSHAAPITALSRLRDLLHAAYLKLPQRFRRVDDGRHQYRSRATGVRMVLAGGLTVRLRAERIERASLAGLRAECDRMAQLLTGVRRGRADAARFAHAVSRVKSTLRAPARNRFAGPRFLNTARATRTAIRTAGRETAAVAARAARRMGAQHRHVPGQTDVYHNLVADLVTYAKQFERSRAAGERPWWQQGMRLA
jgi:hypothetical protein